jgi:hypothetical protein
MIIPNLLLIAGTGTKSGKTSMVCRIIEQFTNFNIYAIKISPHFHETTSGLITKSAKEGYTIYEETSRDTSKDTSRMLNSGAHKVFFAKGWDDKLPVVFYEIMKNIPSNVPVICESPALRNYIEPGVFIIMTSNVVNKQKELNHLLELPHLMVALEELKEMDVLPIGFEEGKWFYKECSQKSEVRSRKI